MKAYRNYLIEKITRVDYIVRDCDNNIVELPNGAWSFRTLKETKDFIDTIA